MGLEARIPPPSPKGELFEETFILEATTKSNLNRQIGSTELPKKATPTTEVTKLKQQEK